MDNPLGAMLQNFKNKYGDHPAFRFVEDERICEVRYQNFLQEVMCLSRHYQTMKESRVGLWGYNSYQWITAAIGMLLAGKHVVFFDSNLETRELIELAKYADIELMVLDQELIEEAPDLIPYFRVKTYEFAMTLAETEKVCPEKDCMCFTSGTSRSAKGVVIPTQEIITSVHLADGVLPGHGGEGYFLPQPLYHIYGFTMLFHILKRGGTVCLGRGGKYLLEDLQKLTPKIAFFVPTMLQYLLKQKELPGGLHTVLTGGSWLKPELEKAVSETGIQVYNLYGLSETVGMICASTQQKGCQWLQPFGGIHFFVGKDREIGVYLPFHMKEYYKKAEDTKSVLDQENHIFWTGDAGEVDENGLVRIIGRIRDTIVLENGEKIHGEDMDVLLTEQKGIKEAAVFRWKSGLGAVIVPETGIEETEINAAVEEFNRERIVYTRIRRFWVRKEPLPRTSTGKLKRFQLEQEYGSQKR